MYFEGCGFCLHDLLINLFYMKYWALFRRADTGSFDPDITEYVT